MEIDPLGGARERFTPQAAHAVFASLLTRNDQRILQHFEMPENRGQRNSEGLGEFDDRCIPSNETCHDGPALGVCKGRKCVIEVHK